MPDTTNQGDHDYVETRDSEECDAGFLPEQVAEVEAAAIAKRRECVKLKTGRDRTKSQLTGLAFSGGGIRSASIGLGVLQALQAKFENHPNVYGIESIDYLSTVSGGGYIGCSLTAGLQQTRGKFPFTNADDQADYSDTAAVRHVRDYSNYLMPHGALDVATAIGIIGRGLVANIVIILPVLFFCVWITLFIRPTTASLGKPVDFLQNLLTAYPWIPVLPSLHGYWFTAILAVINILFLFVWALWTSMNLGSSATLRGRWVFVSKVLFVVTLVTAFFETQPFILWVINPSAEAAGGAGSPLHMWLHDFWQRISAFLAAIGTLFGSMAAVFAFFAKYLGEAAEAAERATGWRATLKKFSAIAALWLAGLLVPIILWLIYLWLVYTGLDKELALPGYLAAVVISTFVVLFINPNRTSLYRLYRDRLSKAFLFDPDGRKENRDRYGDLKPYEPNLDEIDPGLGPYPIVNAALNIEGSQYANKRGRNADFFIFTPEYTGSNATGYIGTQKVKKDAATLALGMAAQSAEKAKKDAALDLGTAMAVSGAAVSSNMGALTIKALTFTLAFLNVRLGYWMRNPNPSCTDPSIEHWRDWIIAQLFRLHSWVLFTEMFGWITEKSPKIYLTDGGHVENLGIYSLLKRRCKVIIAVDAEADAAMSFGAFLKLERYARIDLGVTIDLPWKEIGKCALGLDKSFSDAAKVKDSLKPPVQNSQGPHCAACEIRYGGNETGVLFLVKASLSGDEADYILDYKRRYPAFPHESTGDQFFSEEQLEVYRALGFHIMSGMLTNEATIAVKGTTPEAEAAQRKQILATLRAALLGTDAKAAARC
ncbi:MAG: patatin-like phospholipase family protein [Beijerinckiaceae bacterium]|nr:patatin-like phospholipase family protein [Beijerinckiaceae bacterium]MCI0735616.1 patatin-like phospholipase family protein [Beijerinckiaceae bacterium]